jgi:hypothetical protein
MQAKEYISGSYKQKGDMMQGLLMNGEEIYQPDNRNDKYYDSEAESEEDAHQGRNSHHKQRSNAAPTSRHPPYAGEQTG